MKLSALLYIFPLLYAYFAHDLREQPTHHPLFQEPRSTPRDTAHHTSLHPHTPAAADTQDSTKTTPAPAAPLITRSKPGELPRNGRSRNLSELCDSPKTEIPRILALHRTRSADSSYQLVSIQEIKTLPNLTTSSSPNTGSLPSPLSLGHAATNHFDFLEK